MKPGFHLRVVNGLFEDPCLYLRIPWQGRALLFDLGDIHNLSPGEISKITDVFVTHTHIDHFIGFDFLLRNILRREVPLNIFGPSTITSCVEGKLKGYSWNLIRDYPTVINVFAYDGKTLSHNVFDAKKGFKKVTGAKTANTGLILCDPMFKVMAAKLEHDIPCLAFSIAEEFSININKDFLAIKGLPVGPWLTEFKKVLRNNPSEYQAIEIGGEPVTIRQLSGLAKISRGQKISYATDISLTRRNIERLTDLVTDSDIFFCEAYFLEKDIQRAIERNHLTAKTAGKIARKAGVKRLEIIHMSQKYRGCPELVRNEAMEEFLAPGT